MGHRNEINELFDEFKSQIVLQGLTVLSATSKKNLLSISRGEKAKLQHIRIKSCTKIIAHSKCTGSVQEKRITAWLGDLSHLLDPKTVFYILTLDGL